jgi:pimeloyl-ACP methyl ester carboxylesterase
VTIRLPLAGCAPFPGSVNQHGEAEKLGSVEVTHWFVEALRCRMHLVTAGDPAKPPLVMLHGLPESWWAFHNQIRDLSDTYFVIAPDLKGYGQSEKRLDLSYQFPHCAFELALLLDQLGVGRFLLAAHDRGSVLGDWLCCVPGMQQRIVKYARMQQSFMRGHAEPRPPHALFATAQGVELFLSPAFVPIVYSTSPPPGVPKLVHVPLAPDVIARLAREFSFPGLAHAVSRCFQHTNFDLELEDRQRFVLSRMTMPVRLIQGEKDPGQPPSDYAGFEQHGANFSLRWIEGAGHFHHLERPDVVTEALREFFAER